MSNVIKYKRIFTSSSGDPSLDPRITILENNEYKITYFTTVSTTTGTIVKPTNSTILLDQFAGGIDAYVSTILNGQPTGIFPQTAGGVTVDVSSFDALGNYTFSGTPSSFDVAIIYKLKIKAIDYSNLIIDNILDLEEINIISATQAEVNTGTNTDKFVTPATLANATTVEKPLTFSTGLTRVINTITNNLSIGVSGGQTVIGGTAVGDALILKGTTGNGTVGVAAIVGNVGNNGAINAFNVYNDGQFLINTTTRNSGSFGLLRIAQGTALVDIGQSSSGNGAIYLGQATPSASNWALSSSGTTFTLLNAPTTSGTVGITAGSAASVVMGTFTGPSTSGARTTVLFNTGGSNNQTVGTNIPGFRITPSTRQWATGAITLQAENMIDQPTYSSVGASTMSDGYNFYVAGAPIATGSLTLTRGWAAGFNGNISASKMYVGSLTIAPTGLIHLAAGTTGTAPVQYTTGTLLTTITALAREANTSSFYATTVALNRYAEGGIIADFTSDVNNSGTGETDLYTYTTKANTLAATGEKVEAWYSGTFNDLTATNQLRLYFGGTLIGDTGLLTISAIGGWSCNVLVIRTGASTARAVVTINTPGASTALYTSQTDLTGLTFTNTNIIKITGTAAGATGGSNDITAKLGTVYWYGSAANI